MLKTLTIENVALIDRAELDFSAGLNVLSGETGAGKSVILDCIDFVLGAKADKSMIRYGAPFSSVSAVFDCKGERLAAVLEELDIAAEDELVISRKLTSDGRGTLRVNGTPVTVAMLRRITSLLVDVHGQSEHFFLLKESNQLLLLDSVAGEEGKRCLAAGRTHLSERRRLLAELEALGGDRGELERRLDILKFQIDEIERANISEGEKDRLLALRDAYRNSEKIIAGLSAARDSILSDGAAADALRTASRSLRSIAKYSDAYSELAERIENAAAEIEDAGDSAERAIDELDVDEREAERAETRLEEIKLLERKYGGSEGAILAFLEKAKSEYDYLSMSGERREKLKEELEGTDERLYAACVALTEVRKSAAEGFTRRVTEELRTLDIPKARFEIEFGTYSRDDLPAANSEGLGTVRFLFSANAGEPLKELGKIISGGEMSRFMLAVKAQLTALGGIGTYVFDEIDAGIGGRTARVVGEKFCKISQSVQIIAVSHLARIASLADREFYIEKEETEGRAVTRIKALREEERKYEIARLLGGDPESDSAKSHAEELLNSAAEYKKSL